MILLICVQLRCYTHGKIINWSLRFAQFLFFPFSRMFQFFPGSWHCWPCFEPTIVTLPMCLLTNGPNQPRMQQPKINEWPHLDQWLQANKQPQVNLCETDQWRKPSNKPQTNQRRQIDQRFQVGRGFRTKQHISKLTGQPKIRWSESPPLPVSPPPLPRPTDLNTDLLICWPFAPFINTPFPVPAPSPFPAPPPPPPPPSD